MIPSLAMLCYIKIVGKNLDPVELDKKKRETLSKAVLKLPDESVNILKWPCPPSVSEGDAKED